MKRSFTARRAIAVASASAAVVAGLTATSVAFAAPSSPAARVTTTSTRTVPACTSGDLGAWVAIDQGNGAAGSIFYPLQFTNISGHSCQMGGFPGVSVLDRNGHQLGSPAGRDHISTPRTVVLAPGATAHDILRYSDAEVSTAPGCHPVSTAFELRIFPPNQRTTTHAFFGLESCSHAGPVYLSVTPIVPGPGTING